MIAQRDLAVWRFPIPVRDIGSARMDSERVKIEMPRDALILSVQSQNGDICIWAQVDPKSERHVRTFRVVGTGYRWWAGPYGQTPTNTGHFLGTCQFYDGSLVLHVYERFD